PAPSPTPPAPTPPTPPPVPPPPPPAPVSSARLLLPARLTLPTGGGTLYTSALSDGTLGASGPGLSVTGDRLTSTGASGTARLTAADAQGVKREASLDLAVPGTRKPARIATIGDSIFLRGQVQAGLAKRTGATLQGTRGAGPERFEARGGWQAGSYVQAGSAAGTDSPYLFPQDLAGSSYRGNVAFWRDVIGVEQKNLTRASDPARYYMAFGYGAAAREGGGELQYGADGYPLRPQAGWVVYDPAQSAPWQRWDGRAWTADTPHIWALDYGKYLDRHAWAFKAGRPTDIVVMLGTNDFSSRPVTDASWGTYRADTETLVTSALLALPGVRVTLLAPPMASASSDARARTLTANMRDLRARMLQTWDTPAWATRGMRLSIATAAIDPVRDFTATDYVHPEASGLDSTAQWLAADLNR
ncbi:SGNH/GDSL hydrolase family protein, partial [Deinococcus frigens]